MPKCIDYALATHDELDEYGMQLLVWDAPELSVVLKGHLLIERCIEALISANLKQPDLLFKNHRIGFEMKVDIASAMGLLPKSHMDAAKELNNIRNAYAFREDHELKLEELNSLKIQWIASQKKLIKWLVQKVLAKPLV